MESTERPHTQPLSALRSPIEVSKWTLNSPCRNRANGRRGFCFGYATLFSRRTGAFQSLRVTAPPVVLSMAEARVSDGLRDPSRIFST